MVDFFQATQSAQPTVQTGTLPAPVKGINSVMSLAGMSPEDAILTVNIDASPYGLVVRPGYVEYANGFTGDETKTIIPFTGSMEDGSNDRIFATTNDGIFDVTSGTPIKVFNFVVKSTDAGWGIFVQVVNDGGDHALLLTDSANGVFQYLESSGLWGAPTVSGPTGTLVFVTKWKERTWYIEENSTSAWYTELGDFTGVVTEFNFGNKFRAGGNLVAVYSWTLDAGDGSDDYLVAVSSAGDVVVYSGTDPSSSSTFGQIGRWFIGAMPAGRRVGSQFGGDLLLLSSYGLVSAGDLLKGENPFTQQGSLSWKIQGFLSTAMAQTRTELGWEVKLHPSLNIIIISTPKVINLPYRQFVYNINVEAWSIWEDVPILTSESYQGTMYIASELSSLWTMGGYLDNVTLSAPEDNRREIEWRGLTSYSSLGADGLFKRVSFIRPVFISDLTPHFSAVAKYEYDLQELDDFLNLVQINQDLWDQGLWDVATWGGSPESRLLPPRGASGMGRVVAISWAGKSHAKTTLAAFGISYDAGGMM